MKVRAETYSHPFLRPGCKREESKQQTVDVPSGLKADARTQTQLLIVCVLFCPENGVGPRVTLRTLNLLTIYFLDIYVLFVYVCKG